MRLGLLEPARGELFPPAVPGGLPLGPVAQVRGLSPVGPRVIRPAAPLLGRPFLSPSGRRPGRGGIPLFPWGRYQSDEALKDDSKNRSTQGPVARAEQLHYNFARPHKSLEDALLPHPAMAAGVDDHVWTLNEIAGLLD